MRLPYRITLTAAASAVLALATSSAAAQVSASALQKLEAKRASSPQSVSALRALGVAYFKMKRYGDAQSVLAEARKLSARDGVVALYLGMSAEEQGDLTAAREAYTAYLSVGKTRSARDDVAKRLAAVARREMQASAKTAVANEQRLASQPGDARTLAVLPWSVSGDATYAPLGRGLADLMISDFGLVKSLTLLERDRVQFMLDEIALGQSGQVDPSTAARSGRLLRAGSVVRGNLTATPQTVQMNAGVVNVNTSAISATSDQTGSMNAIFDLEKALVVDVIQKMGITLTAAERRAIDGYRPTQNIQAFLAYSRGLAAKDAGRLDEALNFFDNARALDPGFRMAAQRASDARAAQAGAAVTTTQIESRLTTGAEGQIVSAAERGATAPMSDALGNTLSSTLADVNPSAADAIGRVGSTAATRDATSSVTTQDSPVTKTGSVTIIIKRP